MASTFCSKWIPLCYHTFTKQQQQQTSYGIISSYYYSRYFKLPKQQQQLHRMSFNSSSFPLRSFSSSSLQFSEVVKPQWLLEEPNFIRRPIWRQWWEAQFSSRALFVLGSSWASFLTLTGVLWWSRLLDPPPPERYDLYWYNSPKFRIMSARENPGSRPGLTISQLTWTARYNNRGMDHPFSLNELKDSLFKLRENLIIQAHPGVQYPYVFKNINSVQTPATLKVPLYPLPQKANHSENAAAAVGHSSHH
eukprot:GHVS01089555.1.p1 GENE.GHVS01089555.1~~GHVS01089555.1.p1  ORF type:complete len:250 (+),score=31.05 GHVS01089555.1:160-909(+)